MPTAVLGDQRRQESAKHAAERVASDVHPHDPATRLRCDFFAQVGHGGGG